MAPSGYFVDANLLVLLVVGSTDRDLIPKHRRLRRFSTKDFDLLERFIAQVGRVYVTPNTLTETSNLLAQHADPELSLFFDRLRFIIHESEEVVITSERASTNTQFSRLGLADSALLEAVTEETPVLTVDLHLYLAALEKSPDTAVNFTHFQDL